MSFQEEEAVDLILQLDIGDEFVPDELDLLTRELGQELKELDVESVGFVKEDETPEGTKSADPVTIGVLAVAVLPTLLPKFIEYLQSWSMRSENRRIKIKTQVGERSIELEYSPAGVSKDDLKDLIRTINAELEV